MHVLKDYREMSSVVADLVQSEIEGSLNCKLCLPTGSTPLGLYKELINRELDWDLVTTFNLDEYIINRQHPQSYYSFMKKNFFDKINIKPNSCYFPSRPTLAYEDIINHFGGIDLCILGIGTNGHIAFNEPGSPFNSRTRVVNLDDGTRSDNSRFFESFNEVPKQAITMGLATIMEAKKIVLMANGVHKFKILNVAMNSGINEKVPASVLQNHNNLEVYYSE